MTEPTVEPGEDSPRAHLPQRGFSAVRTLLLIGALSAIVAGGLWDHYGAKAPREAAYGAIQDLQGGTGDVSQPVVTQDQVRAAIGRAPTKEWVEEGVAYELYSWRRGMPIWTYDMYVAYADESKQLLVADLDEQPHAAMYGELVKRRVDPTTAGTTTPDAEPSEEASTEPGANAEAAPTESAPADGEAPDASELDAPPAAASDTP